MVLLSKAVFSSYVLPRAQSSFFNQSGKRQPTPVCLRAAILKLGAKCSCNVCLSEGAVLQWVLCEKVSASHAALSPSSSSVLALAPVLPGS